MIKMIVIAFCQCVVSDRKVTKYLKSSLRFNGCQLLCLSVHVVFNKEQEVY